ncbi:MAG: hypothetical protein IPI04_04280 [Ignavibacteria bacterium]|nr:hypothetical protein [Ignavibacteria bacterium]
MSKERNDIQEIRFKFPGNFAKAIKKYQVPKVMDGVGGIIPQVLSFHHITVTGTSEFHDYETFGDDEHGTRLASTRDNSFYKRYWFYTSHMEQRFWR